MLEESWAGCWGWRNEETGSLVSTDLVSDSNTGREHGDIARCPQG